MFGWYLRGEEVWISTAAYHRGVERKREYHRKNKEALRIKARERYINGGFEVVRAYNKANREKLAKYRRERRKERIATDPVYRAKMNAKAVMRRHRNPLFAERHKVRMEAGKAIKAIIAGNLGRKIRKMGVTTGDLKRQIEGTWKEGMHWGNYGEWVVDHIVPLGAAETIEEVLALAGMANVQALWVRENVEKGTAVPEVVGESLWGMLPERLRGRVRFSGR